MIYHFHRGFPEHVICTLAAWVERPCGDCAGHGGWPGNTVDRCEACRGTGRVDGAGPRLVRTAPIAGVTLMDRRPVVESDLCWWGRGPLDQPHNLPDELFPFLPGRANAYSAAAYPSEAAAVQVAGEAALAWARAAAGLPALNRMPARGPESR